MRFHENLLAYCGLYCEQCSFRVAAQTGDRCHLQQMPRKYDALLDRPFQELACGGCKEDNQCGPCAIRDCAEGRGYVSCADCGDFPCGKINDFAGDGIPHHRRGVENLKQIRAFGVQAWFSLIHQDLACHCGQRQSWYYDCPIHGRRAGTE